MDSQSSLVDNKVLSYGDVVLFESDVALLETGDWFNDRLISFSTEYTLNQMSAEERSKVEVISAPVCEIIKFIDEGLEYILSGIDFTRKEMILFVINDNVDPSLANGGQHWSLLIFDRRTASFHYYDSLRNPVSSTARMVSSKVSRMFDIKSSDRIFVEEICPKQDNGMDCGVYVVEFIRIALEVGHTAIGTTLMDFSYIANRRKQLKHIICNLSQRKRLI